VHRGSHQAVRSIATGDKLSRNEVRGAQSHGAIGRFIAPLRFGSPRGHVVMSRPIASPPERLPDNQNQGGSGEGALIN
jgi:hypothetical protein